LNIAIDWRALTERRPEPRDMTLEDVITTAELDRESRSA
jgi:hypothetical protein